MYMTNQEAYRFDDFIEFHNESCKADTIVGVLKAYLDIINASKKQKEMAVLFYCLTYSVPSTIVLLLDFDKFLANKELYYNENKEKLVFQSDRRWTKYKNEFIPAFDDFIAKKIFEEFEKKETINVKTAVKSVERVEHFGRFSAFLFLETYCAVFNKELEGCEIDWKHGDTVTSGMLNVLKLDNYANLWDKYQNLDIDNQTFNDIANYLLLQVKYGKSIAILETNLCAYRKLFKGSRYLGYYADRILEELNFIIKQFPEYKSELQILYTARKEVVPEKYLGELQGWTGIRKELKKHYIKTGDWRW